MTTSKKKPNSQARTKQAAGRSNQQGRKIPWLGIAFGAIALALVSAILFTGGEEGLSDSERIDRVAGSPEISGESLPPLGGGTDAAVGQQAPRVVGADIDGNEVAFGGDGPTAVLFLAHWCPHCQAEVPRVQQWLDSGGGVEGVEIVSVATSFDPARGNWPPQDWLGEENWTQPVLYDDTQSSVLAAFGAGAFPFWVFLDDDGNVVQRVSGELDIPTLEALLTVAANA